MGTKVKITAQSCTANKCQSWDLNPTGWLQSLCEYHQVTLTLALWMKWVNECKDDEGVNNIGSAVKQSRVWISALLLISSGPSPSLYLSKLSKCFSFSAVCVDIPSQTCCFPIKGTSTNVDEMPIIARYVARHWEEIQRWVRPDQTLPSRSTNILGGTDTETPRH